MRTKFFILLALFVALSSVSFAQVSHLVTVDLTENRTLALTGFPPTIDVSRAAIPVVATDTSTELEIFHDLALPQKVTVQAAITSGDWIDRYLTVLADDAAWPQGPGAGITPAPTALTLISNGVVAGVQNLATAITNTMAAGDTIVLEYGASAGLLAAPGVHTSTVTYTMLDM